MLRRMLALCLVLGLTACGASSIRQPPRELPQCSVWKKGVMVVNTSTPSVTLVGPGCEVPLVGDTNSYFNVPAGLRSPFQRILVTRDQGIYLEIEICGGQSRVMSAFKVELSPEQCACSGLRLPKGSEVYQAEPLPKCNR